MGLSFTVTEDARVHPAKLNPVEDIAGEDISVAQGVFAVSAHGDLCVVRGVDCARQSVIRELPANPGSFARRPAWGAGLQSMIFKNQSGAQRDRAVSQCRARLIANPRIVATREVTAEINDVGLIVSVRADAYGGLLDETIVVRPPGVQ